jgi:hypothetical protein
MRRYCNVLETNFLFIILKYYSSSGNPERKLLFSVLVYFTQGATHKYVTMRHKISYIIKNKKKFYFLCLFPKQQVVLK